VEAINKGTRRRAHFNREELWALLSFTGKGDQYGVVHLRINGRAALEAGATDGKRAVECIGKAKDCAAGEWAIDSAYLEQCRAALKKGEALVLELTDKGIGAALIVDAESGDTISTINWNREAANTQITMREIVGDLKVPKDKNHTGSWCAIDPEVLRGLTRVRVATDGMPVTIYPPSEPTAPLYFEARAETGHWKGSVVPEAVLGPGDGRDEPDDEDDGAPGNSANARQTRLDLADRAKVPKADADDGIIEDAEAERLKAEQAGDDEPELETSKRKRTAKVKPSQMKPKKGRGK
jgi:hypothetical protein